VRITGHQWWWEVQYPDAVPSNTFTTANEVHIPVGKLVKFEIRSMDVIHSFWVPNLHGKKDMIPGHDTSLWIKPDRVGTFVGECAEFCGLQHAKMRFTVVVDPPEQYAAWLEAQRKPAANPQTTEQEEGRQVFMTRGRCFMCHSVVGTPAMSRLGPDLTHIASRPTIAAGTLPNTPGHLAGWIVDPQGIKPGSRMSQNPLAPADLQNLLAYLKSLK
jgi:cytochrome c oxidase subunit II